MSYYIHLLWQTILQYPAIAFVIFMMVMIGLFMLVSHLQVILFRIGLVLYFVDRV